MVARHIQRRTRVARCSHTQEPSFRQQRSTHPRWLDLTKSVSLTHSLIHWIISRHRLPYHRYNASPSSRRNTCRTRRYTRRDHCTTMHSDRRAHNQELQASRINNHRATLIDSIDRSSNQHTSTISQLKVQQIAFADRVARVALVDRHELTDDHRTRLRYANDIDARLVCKLALNLCHDIGRECEVGAFDRARARARV